MSILNRPSDGLLSVLIALWRAVATYGALSEERLLRLCAPASVVGDKPDMARKTLTRWQQLGLFTTEAGDRVGLAQDVKSIDVANIDAFRRAVLRIVVGANNNTALTSDDDTDNQESSLASDFTRAAAWALSQDPSSMPSTSAKAEALHLEQRVDPRPFVNDTRWQGFLEWSVFCGLAVTTQRTFVPNPAFAIRTALDRVFEGAAELPQELFLSRLASELPIVDGGSYRKIVDATIARPWRKLNTNELSPTLSLALQQLEASGDLLLESRSDAPQRRLLGAGGRDMRGVSHVMRAGGSS